MRVTTALALAPNATLDADSDPAYATLVFGARTVRLTVGSPAIRAALRRLVAPGASEAELAATIGVSDRLAIVQWSRLLGALRSGGWLDQTMCSDGEPLLTLRSSAACAGFGSAPAAAPLTDDLCVQLSRFATMRVQDGVLAVDSPRTAFAVDVHDRRVGVLLAAMASPAPLGDLVKMSEPTLRADEVRAAVRVLLAGGLASLVERGEADAGPPPVELEQWSHHDLLFHARSRMGRHTNAYGGTFRFVGSTEPLPAARPVAGAMIELIRPDPRALQAADPSLSAVIEQRASVREHDDASPITLDQLGELLFRSQRLRWVHPVPEHGEVASRPYPSGGGLYELEIYPVVRNCAGLEPGMYHYDSAGHRLATVTAAGPESARLLEMARITCLMDAVPQVLLVVAARFGRVMWKYESVSYAVILKNVGALYQTLYLHATAMGLAPCALGGGDSDLFAEAARLPYDEETSVGEFVIGSRPPGWVRPAEPEWSAAR